MKQLCAITMTLFAASFAGAQIQMTTSSEEAYLRPLATPVFTTQPLSGTVSQGGSYTLTAEATLDPLDHDPIYQWSKDGSAAGTGTSLEIVDFQAEDAGVYVCSVTTYYFATPVASADAVLELGLYTSPQITGPTPNAANRYETDAVTFSVSVILDPADSGLVYQWYKGGTDNPANTITGATDSALSLSNLSSTDSGQFACTVATVLFPAETGSNAAALTVYVKPTVSIIGNGLDWNNVTNLLVVLLGGTAEFSAVVVPHDVSDPLPQIQSFAWYFKGNPITLDAAHIQVDNLIDGTSTLTINPYLEADNAPIPDPMVPNAGYRCDYTYLPPALP